MHIYCVYFRLESDLSLNSHLNTVINSIAKVLFIGRLLMITIFYRDEKTGRGHCLVLIVTLVVTKKGNFRMGKVDLKFTNTL